MALVRCKLCFSCGLRHVVVNQSLTNAKLVISALLTTKDQVTNLAVQYSLHFLIGLSSLLAFFKCPRFRLNRPQTAWILYNGILLVKLVSLVLYSHLLFPDVSVLSLHLLSVLEFSFLLLIKFYDLICKFLFLADKYIYFFGQNVLDSLILVFVRVVFLWIIF